MLFSAMNKSGKQFLKKATRISSDFDRFGIYMVYAFIKIYYSYILHCFLI